MSERVALPGSWYDGWDKVESLTVNGTRLLVGVNFCTAVAVRTDAEPDAAPMPDRPTAKMREMMGEWWGAAQWRTTTTRAALRRAGQNAPYTSDGYPILRFGPVLVDGERLVGALGYLQHGPVEVRAYAADSGMARQGEPSYARALLMRGDGWFISLAGVRDGAAPNAPHFAPDVERGWQPNGRE